jgi:phosphatidylglycerophosphate synthase
MNRRPIRARESHAARRFASFIARRGITPNQISVSSVFFAAIAGGALAMAPNAPAPWGSAALTLSAVVCMQLRLLANLFDGMVAVEGGKKTPAGEIYNDFPDRIADPLILIGAGYGAVFSGHGPTLGWAAALLSILTAYTRVLGAAAGTRHHFSGPMAKQHRMAVLTIAAVAATVERAFGREPWSIEIALVLIIVGAGVTVLRRLVLIARDLHGGA